MNHKTLLLASAFLAGSILAAGAQSGGNSGAGSSASSAVSASTHCMDQATGQPKLKMGDAGASAKTTAPGAAGSTNMNSTTGSAVTGGAPSMAKGGTSADSTAPAAQLSKC